MRRLLVRLGQWLKLANYWVIAQFAIGVLSLLRRVPPDKALDFADRAARWVGPKVGRHRVALDNLRQAFPEKSEAEIDEIASDMWANMARLAAEYIFLDTLFDFEPFSDKIGRVEVVGVERFIELANQDKPRITITGHTGNFEMLAIAGTVYGLGASFLFRPPNNPFLAKYIFKARSNGMSGLLASRRGVAFTLARILEDNGAIGVLVDQKFQYGIRTTFFGRECETSPLVPKLARQYDADVYPARCIRLPGNRFRLELEPKVELPRDASGEIDAKATAQLLNDIVERWVREHPGQWMWFHKRWKLTPAKAR
ncbi:lipid A biosynthesis lauroyl acyltransferase [Arvimicrobium flavum]|uniref:lipid A biosynthesis lauroyl acyltransferase n=1 Tax=Arvimicrobium flavum TaxID=3393320 RepID=UPI00237A3738|nr:lipid A biosynthesis lauroyl acyltransferase [Mesorhizobium shangrilense]